MSIWSYIQSVVQSGNDDKPAEKDEGVVMSAASFRPSVLSKAGTSLRSGTPNEKTLGGAILGKHSGEKRKDETK